MGRRRSPSAHRNRADKRSFGTEGYRFAGLRHVAQTSDESDRQGVLLTARFERTAELFIVALHCWRAA